MIKNKNKLLTFYLVLVLINLLLLFASFKLDDLFLYFISIIFLAYNGAYALMTFLEILQLNEGDE